MKLAPALIASILTVAALDQPPAAHATGFDEPARWLDHQETPILQAPEFFFELEMKRLAAELHPQVKSILPDVVDDLPAHAAQRVAADLADFDEALQQGDLRPPDPKAARDAHDAMRKYLELLTPAGHDDTTTPAPPPEEFRTSPEKEFPSEFADYHSGAEAFRQGDFDTARKKWESLLERAPGERRYRTVWALFMLGKLAVEQERWADARQAFQRLREEARKGAHDRIGFAAASLGLEALANLRGNRYEDAASLYLEHLASGDPSGVASLKAVVEQMFASNASTLPDYAKNPVLQRVITASILAAGDGESGWLDALEKTEAKAVRDADAVAWIAYQAADYDRAARWLERADPQSPYTLWLRAKLALREGKMDLATTLLAQALPGLPQTQSLESRPTAGTELLPVRSATAELGTLRISRGDFLNAMKLFFDGRHEAEADYMAEGILTIDELKKFVAAHLPAPRKKQADSEATTDSDAADEAAGWIADSVRRILGSRLLRARRYAEARPYFGENEQKTLDQYVALLNEAKRPGISKDRKAGTLMKAAELIAQEGHVLYEISEVQVQASRLTGQEVSKQSAPSMALDYGEKVRFTPPVAAAELNRLKRNANPVLKHWLSDHVAADLAYQAAALLPDNTERTAEILNQAGTWLKLSDEKAADRFYQAIERRCPRTAIGREAIKIHWFVPVESKEEPVADER